MTRRVRAGRAVVEAGAARPGEQQAVLAATRDEGLEGVVAKRLDSTYEPGRHSRAWLKHKHRRREHMLITGWTPSASGRLESFALARRGAAGPLEPAGSASFGLDAGTREQLRARLEAGALAPRRRNRRILWVEPRIEVPLWVFQEPLPQLGHGGRLWVDPTSIVLVHWVQL